MAPTTAYESRLREHGWKKGESCILPISPLGFLGDCAPEGIKWTTILTIVLIAVVLLLISAYFITRGELLT